LRGNCCSMVVIPTPQRSPGTFSEGITGVRLTGAEPLILSTNSALPTHYSLSFCWLPPLACHSLWSNHYSPCFCLHPQFGQFSSGRCRGGGRESGSRSASSRS